MTVSGSFPLNGHTGHLTRAVTTDANGAWSTTVNTTQVGARLTWQAAYAGETGIAASHSTGQVLTVRPTLTTGSSLKWNGSRYTVRHGRSFRINGRATPALAGATLSVQVKSTGGVWKPTGVTVMVAANGTYSTAFAIAKPVRESLRFTYAGSTSRPWLAAYSPGRRFVVTQ